MVEKLKSILKRTRWSLLLKAAVFAVAWLVLPFWLFVLIALYAYFAPTPQSRTVAGPFFVLLILMFLEPTGLLFALIFGAIFFYILLIKELVLIDRRSAYEVTVLFLAFLLVRDFYLREGGTIGPWPLFYSLCAALLAGWLISNLVRFGAENSPNAPSGSQRAAVWLSTLFIWQCIIAGLFLPVDFIYQAAVVFLGIALIVDLVPQHLSKELSREKMLITASVVFVLFVFVLGSARWSL